MGTPGNKADIASLLDHGDALSLADLDWARRHLARLGRLRGRRLEHELGRLTRRLQQSVAQVEARRSIVPEVTFPGELPVSARVDDIRKALAEHQVLVIAGETGSGKSTQLPKICLDAGLGIRGRIGVTQPRRLAARSLASRVAEELGPSGEQLVGYQVRFKEHLAPTTAIKFMTDGILLNEIHRDPQLWAYDAILIDEAHERSLNIDFLLGYLHRLLPERPDLKLIITSATIDTERFSKHFSDAPVIEVSGRSYPVELRYRPMDEGTGDLNQAIAEAVRELGAVDPRGDILVFLSGEREIREAAVHLRRAGFAHTEILPLYARLSAGEQQRIFHPGGQRRIILSTNVAETSLTVPGIRFVIDSGLVRISRYSHRSKVLRLPIEPVSQASANQRAGRCGRLGPGTCIRLYSEEDFNARPEFTEPEILRTSLASVILRLADMGLGDIDAFPFVEPPPPRLVSDAYQVLFELGAMSDSRRILPVGRKLARWPVDVRIGRILLEGAARGALAECLPLAAVLSIQDPRERPMDAQQQADQAHAEFHDPRSDFTALLKLWQWLKKERKAHSSSQFRKRCARRFLSPQRVREWFDLERQFRQLARDNKLEVNSKPASYDALHQSLLAGLLSHAGLKQEDGSYQGARGSQFRLFPGSGLYRKPPKWVVAAELVETTRLYARGNAAIQPEWLEQLGAHALKRSYSDPHFSRRGGRVMAWEQVTLFGLVIVERRRADYGEIDPALSRRLFIREGLVRDQLQFSAPFLEHNRALMALLEEEESKRRSRDLLADESVLEEFLEVRLPGDVRDLRGLRRWLSEDPAHGESLHYEQALLVREDAGRLRVEQYPDSLRVAGQALPLSYHFEPGSDNDGVTLTLPLSLLNQLPEARLQWLVPGLERDKIVALLKTLPKPMRRVLSPPRQYADALLETATAGDREQSLTALLSREFGRMSGLDIPEERWREEALPEHLRLRFEVLGKNDEILGTGRDLAALKARLGHSARRAFMHREGAAFERDGLTGFPGEALPEQISTPSGQRAWPALVDQDTAVGVRVFDTPGEAHLQHQAGILRLLQLSLTDKWRYLKKNTGLSQEARLRYQAMGSIEELVEQMIAFATRELAGEVQPVRDQAAFDDLLQRVSTSLVARTGECAAQLDSVLCALGPVRLALKQGVSGAARSDIDSQLEDLIYDGFLADVSAAALAHYPRYLEALRLRLERLALDPGRDQQRQQQVDPWWQRYLGGLAEGLVYDQAMDRYRWLVEEYRVSLFAQELGTAQKVSPKRLQQAWQEVQAANAG